MWSCNVCSCDGLCGLVMCVVVMVCVFQYWFVLSNNGQANNNDVMVCILVRVVMVCILVCVVMVCILVCVVMVCILVCCNGLYFGVWL